MIKKSLIGSIQQAPLCKYVVFDKGNMIVEHRTLFQQYLYILDPESLLFHKIEVLFGISFYPIKIDANNIIIIVDDHKVYHYDTSSQEITQLTDLILIKNRHFYHGTQYYEKSQDGIRVIEFANYPDVTEFIIPTDDVQDYKIIDYSNTKILTVLFLDNLRNNYKIPVCSDHVQLLDEKIKSFIYIRLSDSEYEKILQCCLSNEPSIQYRLAKQDNLRKVIYSDRFHFHYNNQHRFNKKGKYVRVFQIRPKNKIIRKFRNQGDFTDYALLRKQYILGYLDRKRQCLYNVTTAQIIEEECVDSFLTNDFLFQKDIQNVNIYSIH